MVAADDGLNPRPSEAIVRGDTALVCIENCPLAQFLLEVHPVVSSYIQNNELTEMIDQFTLLAGKMASSLIKGSKLEEWGDFEPIVAKLVRQESLQTPGASLHSFQRPDIEAHLLDLTNSMQLLDAVPIALSFPETAVTPRSMEQNQFIDDFITGRCGSHAMVFAEWMNSNMGARFPTRVAEVDVAARTAIAALLQRYHLVREAMGLAFFLRTNSKGTSGEIKQHMSQAMRHVWGYGRKIKELISSHVHAGVSFNDTGEPAMVPEYRSKSKGIIKMAMFLVEAFSEESDNSAVLADAPPHSHKRTPSTGLIGTFSSLSGTAVQKLDASSSLSCSLPEPGSPSQRSANIEAILPLEVISSARETEKHPTYTSDVKEIRRAIRRWKYFQRSSEDESNGTFDSSIADDVMIFLQSSVDVASLWKRMRAANDTAWMRILGFQYLKMLMTIAGPEIKPELLLYLASSLPVPGVDRPRHYLSGLECCVASVRQQVREAFFDLVAEVTTSLKEKSTLPNTMRFSLLSIMLEYDKHDADYLLSLGLFHVLHRLLKEPARQGNPKVMPSLQDLAWQVFRINSAACIECGASNPSSEPLALLRSSFFDLMLVDLVNVDERVTDVLSFCVVLLQHETARRYMMEWNRLQAFMRLTSHSRAHVRGFALRICSILLPHFRCSSGRVPLLRTFFAQKMAVLGGILGDSNLHHAARLAFARRHAFECTAGEIVMLMRMALHSEQWREEVSAVLVECLSGLSGCSGFSLWEATSETSLAAAALAVLGGHADALRPGGRCKLIEDAAIPHFATIVDVKPFMSHAVVMMDSEDAGSYELLSVHKIRPVDEVPLKAACFQLREKTLKQFGSIILHASRTDVPWAAYLRMLACKSLSLLLHSPGNANLVLRSGWLPKMFSMGLKQTKHRVHGIVEKFELQAQWLYAKIITSTVPQKSLLSSMGSDVRGSRERTTSKERLVFSPLRGFQRNENMPTALDVSTGEQVIISACAMEAEYAPGNSRRPGLVRSNYAVPDDAAIHYFEVEVLHDGGSSGCICVGLFPQFGDMQGLPGHENTALSYKSNGKFYRNRRRCDYGPYFGMNDVIGCCWNRAEGTVSFTKNGTAFAEATFNVFGSWYPIVALVGEHAKIRINYGGEKFKFNFSLYLANLFGTFGQKRKGFEVLTARSALALELSELGFSKRLCMRALELNNDHPCLAGEWLLDHSADYAAANPEVLTDDTTGAEEVESDEEAEEDHQEMMMDTVAGGPEDHPVQLQESDILYSSEPDDLHPHDLCALSLDQPLYLEKLSSLLHFPEGCLVPVIVAGEVLMVDRTRHLVQLSVGVDTEAVVLEVPLRALRTLPAVLKSSMGDSLVSSPGSVMHAFIETESMLATHYIRMGVVSLVSYDQSLTHILSIFGESEKLSAFLKMAVQEYVSAQNFSTTKQFRSKPNIHPALNVFLDTLSSLLCVQPNGVGQQISLLLTRECVQHLSLSVHSPGSNVDCQTAHPLRLSDGNPWTEVHDVCVPGFDQLIVQFDPNCSFPASFDLEFYADADCSALLQRLPGAVSHEEAGMQPLIFPHDRLWFRLVCNQSAAWNGEECWGIRFIVTPMKIHKNAHFEMAWWILDLLLKKECPAVFCEDVFSGLLNCFRLLKGSTRVIVTGLLSRLLRNIGCFDPFPRVLLLRLEHVLSRRIEKRLQREEPSISNFASSYVESLIELLVQLHDVSDVFKASKVNTSPENQPAWLQQVEKICTIIRFLSNRSRNIQLPQNLLLEVWVELHRQTVIKESVHPSIDDFIAGRIHLPNVTSLEVSFDPKCNIPRWAQLVFLQRATSKRSPSGDPASQQQDRGIVSTSHSIQHDVEDNTKEQEEVVKEESEQPFRAISSAEISFADPSLDSVPSEQAESLQPVVAFSHESPPPASQEFDITSIWYRYETVQPTLEHTNVSCSECSEIIKGIRYQCINCYEFNFCHECHLKQTHQESHIFMKIMYPVDHAPPMNVPEMTPLPNASDHQGVSCSACAISPIIGIRFKCANCPNFNLCEGCAADYSQHHTISHTFLMLRKPIAADQRIPTFPMAELYEPHWGYRFTVCSRLTDRGRERLISEHTTEIDALVNQLNSWTMDHDAELISYINSLSARRDTSPFSIGPQSVQPSAEEMQEYSCFSKFSLQDVRARLALLQLFNQELLKGIHLIGLSKFPFCWSIGAQLRSLRALMFTYSKVEIWEKMLEGTYTSMSMPSVTINRHQAANCISESDTVFGQTYQQLKKEAPESLRQRSKAWEVTLTGEGAEDAGGPYNEMLSDMCAELQSSALRLFVPCANGKHETGENRDAWVPNAQCSTPRRLALYEFVGRLMGIAIRTKNYLAFNFPSLVWKQLLRLPVDRADLEAIDKLAVNAFENFERPGEEGLTEENFNSVIFSNFTTQNNDGREVELIPNGVDVPVTWLNRLEWVNRCEQYKLQEFAPQCAAMRRGIASIVPSKFLFMFTWQELMLSVCGHKDMDLSLLQHNTIYVHCSERDEHVQYFWKVMNTLTLQQFTLFLRFVWGRSRLPSTHSEFDRKFEIHSFPPKSKDEDLDSYLPQAHTCFFSIDLPAYSSEDVMRARLLYAITHCRAIDNDFLPGEWIPFS